jgi:bifunctional non-homologous end joining protein LigD
LVQGAKKKTSVKSHVRRGRAGKLIRVKGHERALTSKPSEFAPGIPKAKAFKPIPSIAHPQHWFYSIQEHKAAVRGTHYDLRLGHRGNAYSWAISKIPKPGEATWAIEQPTHAQWYMDFEGTIAKGEYGAGSVRVDQKGMTIVHESSPSKINFTTVDAKKTEDFALVRTGDRMWRLINYTLPGGEVQALQFKPKYLAAKAEPEKYKVDNPAEVLSAKIDGAHGIMRLNGGKRPRVFSYRKPKAGGYIEWTHKIPGLFQQHVPRSIGDTWVRVEVWGSKGGKPLESTEVAGYLNSGVLKSRESQKERGKLRVALIDVYRWKGNDAKDASGEEKLEILRTIKKRMPYFGLPQIAETPRQKTRMLERIKAGKHPQTAEGAVAVPRGAGRFKKVKFRPAQDVYVRGFYPVREGTKRYGTRRVVGGFYYSDTPGGKIVGRVGTGLNDALRRDMAVNPNKYRGRVAMVAGSRYASGVGRTLSFKGWHPEKGAVGGYTQHELKPAVSK